MFERGVCNMLIGAKFVSYDLNEGESNGRHEEPEQRLRSFPEVWLEYSLSLVSPVNPEV